MLQDIIARGDVKQDGRLDYQEFMMFMLTHERNLWKHFVQLDQDGNGRNSRTFSSFSSTFRATPSLVF